MKKILITTISTTIILMSGFLYVVPTQVFAQTLINKATTYTLLAPLPVIPGVQQDSGCVSGNNTLTCISFNTFIQYAFKFAIALAVFLAIVMIIYNGFKYMMSETSFTSKSDAREGITNAVLGLLGALACYLILLTIDPRLVQINTSIPQITVAGCSTNSTTGQITCGSTTTLQNQLGANLKALNSDNINTLTNLQNQSATAQSRIDEIKNTMSQPGYVPNPALDAELASLQQTIASNNSQSTQILASGTAGNSFNTVLGYLHSTQSADKNGVFNQYTLDAISNSKTQITNAYTTALKDPSIVNDPAATQKLQYEESFYLTQLDNEKAFDSLIIDATNNPGSATGVNRSDMDSLLTSYTNEYAALTNTDLEESNILIGNIKPNPNYANTQLKMVSTPADLTKIKADPVLLAQYQAMLSDRIANIKAAEGKTP